MKVNNNALFNTLDTKSILNSLSTLGHFITLWVRTFYYRGITYYISKRINTYNIVIYSMYSNLNKIYTLLAGIRVRRNWLRKEIVVFNSDEDDEKHLNMLHKLAKEDIDFLLDSIVFGELIEDYDKIINILLTLLKSNSVDKKLKNKILEYYKCNKRDIYLRLLRR